MEKSKENLNTQKWIVAIAVILFLVKTVAYFLTKSVAVLTDALESIVNVIAGFIGLYSLYVAAKPRDDDHPYGHGKAEFLSSAVEGVLISIAGLIIIYESVRDFISPHPLRQIDYGILLIAFSGIINFIFGKISLEKGKKNNSAALVASGKHLLSDTYSTAGIVIGLVLIFFTHKVWIDGVVAIIFSVVIIYAGYSVLRVSIAGIMDEADKQLLVRLIEFLNNHRRENWIDMHNLRVIKYGSVLHIDCHITVPWYLNTLEAHTEVESLTQLIKTEFGSFIELFVHTDPCLDFSCSICTKMHCNVRKKQFEKKIEWDAKNVIADRKHSVTA
ncbi:MAG TPA: cation diffusion facilitator family transporter [Puia sp.]|nr:cation diffusion facilitator family transporter [Puia sp.]